RATRIATSDTTDEHGVSRSLLSRLWKNSDLIEDLEGRCSTEVLHDLWLGRLEGEVHFNVSTRRFDVVPGFCTTVVSKELVVPFVEVRRGAHILSLTRRKLFMFDAGGLPS